jgi:hypothetical protein
MPTHRCAFTQLTDDRPIVLMVWTAPAPGIARHDVTSSSAGIIIAG